MSATDMPKILVDAAELARLNYSDMCEWWSDREAARAMTVAVLRTLAGPEHGRDNHILMTGNMLHTLADLTEAS